MATNPPPRGNSQSSGISRKGGSAPKSVHPEQRVKEHKGEPLAVSNGKLLCCGCCEEPSLKSSTLKSHLLSSKNHEGKRRLDRKEASERDIAEALVQHNSNCHPCGETLPAAQA